MALLVALLAWRTLQSDPVDLAWDGQVWLANGAAGRVDVMLDVAGFLLLRFRPVPAALSHWIAFSRRNMGAAEHGLRVALYARAPVAADGATEFWRGS